MGFQTLQGTLSALLLMGHYEGPINEAEESWPILLR